MHQLLPEVRSIFNRLENGKEIYEDEPLNKEWGCFLSFVKEMDNKIEKEKTKIITRVPSSLQELVKDALHTKRNNDRALNGYLAILSLGKEPKKFIDVLCALEVLDSSVLIIDDLLDNAEKRANKPAYHKKWGADVTFTTAMFLKSFSSQIVIESRLEKDIKLKILLEMENYHSKIYEGQLLDVRYEKKGIEEISEQEYLQMIVLTTGYQISSSFRIGGILSGEEFSRISLLGEMGLRLGILGQIRDDLVDYLPDEKEIWKTPLLDFKRNRKRIPLIIGWRNATLNEREKILSLQKKKQFSNEDYLKILKIIMKPQNLQRIRIIMQRFKKEGEQLVDKGNFTSKGKRLLKAYFSYGIGEI